MRSYTRRFWHSRAALRAACVSLALVAGGCAASPGRIDRIADASFRPGAGPESLIVVQRDWHTDIALPIDEVTGALGGLGARYPGVRFLEFGFGDRAYYQSHDTSVGQQIAALFPGPGVILLTALRVPPEQAFGADHVATLHMTAEQIDGVISFLERSLTRGPGNGAFQRLDDGPYPGSAFYASNDTYDLFHNCNRWTLEAVMSSRLPVRQPAAIFAGEVMPQIRAIEARQQGAQDSGQTAFPISRRSSAFAGAITMGPPAGFSQSE